MLVRVRYLSSLAMAPFDGNQLEEKKYLLNFSFAGAEVVL
jgi:hypothetical protein